MPTRVLAFESDPDFSRELNTQFSALGCEVTVVDDVNLGLQAASVSKPDLILLTIELPRMSGYSVCNKIKRDAGLKDIPLIILSSESTDQTFEQHRRLGTRAQDYIRKPVTFAKLLEHVSQFVNMGGVQVSVSPEDDGIIIDDEIELTDDALISSPPAASNLSPSHRPIDADIDDFAEHAFGAIIESPASTQPSQRPTGSEQFATASAIPSSPRLPSDLLPHQQTAGNSEAARAQEEARKLKTQLEEKERLLAEAQGELKEMRRTSRAALSDAAEVENLRRELQEAKAKQGASIKPGAGPTAREFLDLREQLNKKDKELLDLRDQITHKDKELLALRDSSLALEREKADLSDKVDEQFRQLTDLQKIADAAKNDKEAAAKRAEDHKRKAEKLAGQLEEKTSELEKSVERHSTEIKERDAERERVGREHAAAEQSAREEFAQILANAERDAVAAQEKALAELVAQAEIHESQALEGERQSSSERKAAALAELEDSLRAEWAADKSAALGRLQSEKDASEQQRDHHIDQLRSDIERMREELNQALSNITDRDQRIGNLEENLRALGGELEQTQRVLESRDERIRNLESDLAQQRNEIAVTQETLSVERHKLALALNKWSEDQASLEGLKDALAAALVQVETIEARSLE